MSRSFISLLVIGLASVLLVGCKEKASQDETELLSATAQIGCESLNPCKISIVDLETGIVQIDDARITNDHYRETILRWTLGSDSSIVTEGVRIGCHLTNADCDFRLLSRNPREVFITNQGKKTKPVSESTATISFR